MCADIHDGQEHKPSVQGPNTEAQDQSSPDHQIQLATHGRSIQRCQNRKSSAHSMTSSASSNIDVGIVTPIKRAVLRFAINLKRVGRSTGRSEIAAPPMTLPIRTPACAKRLWSSGP